MALGDRKIPEVFNKKTGGSKDARSITSERELEMNTTLEYMSQTTVCLIL